MIRFSLSSHLSATLQVSGRCVVIGKFRKQTELQRKIIGAKLAVARTEMGLTQRDVAAILGIPQAVVCDIETGRRRCDIAELITLAHLYKKLPSELIDPLDNQREEAIP